MNRDASFDVQVDDRRCRVVVFGAGESAIDLAIDGQRGSLALTSIGERRLVHGPAGDIEFTEMPRFPAAQRAQFRGGLVAPMPGRVLSIMVAEGDAVERGQLLLVLEAMKMEHRITAPTAGTVKSLKVAEGEQVANGAMLVVLDSNKEQSRDGKH